MVSQKRFRFTLVRKHIYSNTIFTKSKGASDETIKA